MTNIFTTREQTARALDVDTRTLARYQNRADDPLPVARARPGKPSEYDPRAVTEWAIRQEIKRMAAAAGHDLDAIDYQAERARLTRAQAEAQELKNAQTRRQVAPVELLTYALANVGAQISAHLETIPGRLKREIPALNNSDLFEAQRIIAQVQNAAASVELDWSQAPGDYAKDDAELRAEE